MATQTKKPWTPKPDHVGYLSKSTIGQSTITVEQDITLKKGDKIVLEKMSDKFAGMLKSGKVSEEVVEAIKAKTPDWKTHEARVYTPKK